MYQNQTTAVSNSIKNYISELSRKNIEEAIKNRKTITTASNVTNLVIYYNRHLPDTDEDE